MKWFKSKPLQKFQVDLVMTFMDGNHGSVQLKVEGKDIHDAYKKAVELAEHKIASSKSMIVMHEKYVMDKLIKWHLHHLEEVDE